MPLFSPEYFDKYRTSPRVSWAYHIAEQVYKYPKLVDPELYAQAKSYYIAGQAFETLQGLSPERAAKELYESGYRFFGWKASTVRKTLFPGQLPEVTGPAPKTPAEAIKRGLPITGESFVRRWNKEALTQRLITSVRRGPFSEEQSLKSFYSHIAARASQFGLKKEVYSTVPSPELYSAFFPVKSAIKSMDKRLIGGLGFAGLVLGLYALKPLSLFSGKDDDYNTIKGLPHGGEAEKKRKELTDFGSGWRGILALPKVLQSLVGQHGMSMTREKFAQFMTGKISSAAEKSALQSFLFKMGRAAPGEEIAIFNRALKGTVAHESFHRSMSRSGLRGELDIQVPRLFAKKFSGMKKEDIAEEYVAYALEAGFTNPGNIEAASIREYYRQNILPALITGNTIEGFTHRGMAGIVRPGYGFGSGSVLNMIVGLAKKMFNLSSKQPSRANLGKSIAQALGPKGTAILNPKQLAVLKESEIELLAKAAKPRASEFAGKALTFERSFSRAELASLSTEDLFRRIGIKSPPPQNFNVQSALGSLQAGQKGPKGTLVLDKQTWNGLHKKAQMDMATYSLRPGKGHTRQTGKIKV